ncbi:MAG: diphosphate--fructose-6-phosphate 1-phosphotransferase [Thermomicrobiales bacterium]
MTLTPISAGPTLLIGQSGGATAAINASLAGVIAAAQASGAFPRILGMLHGANGLMGADFMDLTGLDAATLDGLRRTPSSALGTSRRKLTEAELDPALDLLAAHGITAMVYIGGNDSADTAHRLAAHAAARKQALQVIAVPKTVDNDLLETDFCPGYPSMAKAIATYVRDATWDTLSSAELYPVKFIEVAGRDAGWVAAAGGLGFSDEEIAADLAPRILLPEKKPESAEVVIADVQDDLARRGWSVVVVPETLTQQDGVAFDGGAADWTDDFGHVYHASTGAALARLTRSHLDIRARFEKPGSALRMAMALASPVDLAMAWDLGQEAVAALLRGETARMTALQRTSSAPYAATVTTVPVQGIANQVRRLPEAWQETANVEGNRPFREWALPLLGEAPFLPYTRLRGA